MLHKKIKLKKFPGKDKYIDPIFGSKYLGDAAPKYVIPKNEMPPQDAYQIVHDEIMLDGNSRLNLATFVTTWMGPEARQLMKDTFDKNMIDKDEYPQTAEIEKRCVNMIARLWNSPEAEEATGCSTIGSSEACMLGGMALKWKWRERMKKKGKKADKPNLVINIGYQVCWAKFCRYWDVEMRCVPMEKGKYTLDPKKAIALCDENTIGIVGIMGITYTGQYDDIKALNDALEIYNKKTGYEIGIHVDAASGGFIAPFLQPNLKWDFRLKWVKSINASGHKYGLVFPGVGLVIWRDEKELPKDLIFYVDYLGGEMPTFAINFSRPGSQIVVQYYNFLRLGFEGYKKIQQASQDVALYVSGNIAQMGPFKLITDGSDIPTFCWTLKDQNKNWTLYDLAERLRYNGWLVPAYAMPKNVSDMVVQRIVVKKGFSMDLANLFLDSLKRQLAELESLKTPTKSALAIQKKQKGGSHFHH